MNPSTLEQTPPADGKVYTFYSFKGGVGRSMALANVAAWLSKWGQRVLIVDWDLEAPGIEKYFRQWLRGSVTETEGVVDLMNAFREGKEKDWQACLLSAYPPRAKQIDFICAGRDNDNYVPRLRSLNWEDLFKEQSFGNYLERLRSEWRAKYDAILIDSRTGVTDVGGICTIHLPDIVIAMFTANEQSLFGARNVLRSARLGHSKLPVDRLRLMIIPVPSRDESLSEYKLAEEWRGRFAKEFAEFFDDWMPKDESAAEILNYLKIPYFAYWSFGERIPVLEQTDPDNPKTLAYAYQPLAKLILAKMNWKEAREGARATEEAQRQAAEAERARLRAVEITEEAKRREAEREAEETRQQTVQLQDRIDEYFRRVDDQTHYHFSRAGLDRRNSLFLATISLVLLMFCIVFPIVVYTQHLPTPFVLLIAGEVILILIALPLLLLAYRFRLHRQFARDVGARLTREKAVFRAAGPPYESLRPADAFSLFVERIEGILRGMDPELTMPAANASAAPVESFDQKPSVGVRERGTEFANTEVESVSDDEYLYDAFVSFRPQPVMNEWMKQECLPLLQLWAREELGSFNLFADNSDEGDSPWQTTRALKRSKCLIAFLSPSYFQSRQCLSQWETFRLRAEETGVDYSQLIIPVRIFGGEMFPEEARNLLSLDLRDFVFVGEGFRSSTRYLSFQEQVKELASVVARCVQNAPRFDPSFPIIAPDEVDLSRYEMPLKIPRLT